MQKFLDLLAWLEEQAGNVDPQKIINAIALVRKVLAFFGTFSSPANPLLQDSRLSEFENEAAQLGLPAGELIERCRAVHADKLGE